MDRKEFMVMLDSGHEFTNGTRNKAKLYKQGDRYVLVGNGFCATANSWEFNKNEENMIHFTKPIKIGDEEIRIPRFLICYDEWTVSE